MLIKKPFITIALIIGIVLLTFFFVNFLSPDVKINRLVVAIVQSLAAVACLMVGLFSILYYAIKERNKPTKTQSGTVTKLPGTASQAVVRAMPMTG